MAPRPSPSVASASRAPAPLPAPVTPTNFRKILATLPPGVSPVGGNGSAVRGAGHLRPIDRAAIKDSAYHDLAFTGVLREEWRAGNRAGGAA